MSGQMWGSGQRSLGMRLKPSGLRVPVGRSAVLGAALILDQALALSILQKWNEATSGRNEAAAVLANFPYENWPVGQAQELELAVDEFDSLKSSAPIVLIVDKATVVMQTQINSLTTQAELAPMSLLESMGKLLSGTAHTILSLPPPQPKSPVISTDVLLQDAVAYGWRENVFVLLSAIGAIGNPASLASHLTKLQALSSKLGVTPTYVPADFQLTIQSATAAISAEKARQAPPGGGAPGGGIPGNEDQTALYVVGAGAVIAAVLIAAFA